jgi:hypothetical protein
MPEGVAVASFNLQFRICTETEENHEIIKTGSRSSGRDLNPEPHEYEEMLTTRQRHLVP